MKRYELKVYDDGDCAVRKVTERMLYPVTILFDSIDELQKYLTSFLCIRWPINEVLNSIENATDYEWTEFK